MKTTPIQKLLAGLLLAGFAGGLASGATVLVSDGYNVTGSGTGFGLNAGVNSGINPPLATRLTGSAAATLRYLYTQTGTPKALTAFSITTNRLVVAAVANSGRFTLSGDGAIPFDFASVLGANLASPTNPAVYEVNITMDNDSAGTQRFSFGLGTTEADATTWDFGVQLYRTNAANNYSTIQKRIDTGSSGLASDLNLPMYTNAAGSFGSEVKILLRFTDAGAESSTYSSRVQVSLDAGTNWIYDTATDADLPNGWRLDGGSRFFMWDIASSAAAAYDDFTLSWISGPAPVLGSVRTWTGAGSDSSWSTGANWGGTAPSTGDMLVFNGVTRPANTNNLDGLSVPWVAFKNGGFGLYGNGWTNSGSISNLAGLNTLYADLGWASTAPKTWNLASGSELQLANNCLIDVNGDHTLYGGGTLRVKGTLSIGSAATANPAWVVNEGRFVVDGGTFSSRGGHRIGSLASAATSAQTILSNGATMNLTVAGANLRVGDASNALTSRLVIDNSSLSFGGGQLLVGYVAGATGEVSQVGGTVSNCRLTFSDNGAGSGTYTLSNGVLEAWQIKKTTAAGVANISFDNAVLRALSGASNAFLSGLNLAEVRSGGLTLDAQADVVVAQNLSGAGSFTKSGGGAATLTGVNSYLGSTLVSAGKLVLPTGKAYLNPLHVGDYATLGILVQSAGKTLTNGALTLGDGALSTLSFDLANLANPTVPLLMASSLSANGVVTIDLANCLGLSPGTFVLVDYDGTIGGGMGFGAFMLANLPAGVGATLVNNSANSSIDITITAVPGFRWSGALNSSWDYSTENWVNLQNGAPGAYGDGFPALFQDSALTGVVELGIYPNSPLITVSNQTLPYLWSGGAITTPLLKKFGAASLMRIGGEADQITGLELNGGSFILSNLYDAAFTTVLTDTSAGGTFVKMGPSILTVSGGSSTFGGAILIQEGIFKVGHDKALGAISGATTIAPGATMDLNNFSPGPEPINVSGEGFNGMGAIIDSGSGTAVDTNLREVTMLGDTTLGSPSGTRWDLRARASTGPGSGLKGNGYKLTKVGAGSVSIACQRNFATAAPYWRMNLGDILVKEGGLTFAECLTPSNSPNLALTVLAGASFNVYDLGLTNPLLRNMSFTSAKLTAGGNATDTNVLDGPILLTGANGVSIDSAQLIINGAISGSGSLSLSVTEPGTLVLNGLNSYNGGTFVTNGTLAGTGTLAGNLTMYGGTNSPGYGGVGTLTVNGNVTLGTACRMELNRNLSPNSDRLVVGGTLAFGGILKVVLGPGAPSPQAGDTYQLFSKGSSSSFSALDLPNLSGLPGGLGWDTSKLTLNGSIQVTGTRTSPTIGSASLDGSNLVLKGTGGTAGDNYYVLSSTNVALAIGSWQRLATNTFGIGGSFSLTNSINPALPACFFRLQLP